MHRRKIYREENGVQIPGMSFWVLVNNFQYHLAELIVYADGKIDCWGLMDRDEFLRLLNSGWISLTMPDNTDLFIEDFKVNAASFISFKDNDDFIRELDNAVLRLSGQKSGTDLCVEQFRLYLLDPSDDKLAELTRLFHNLPKHRRVIFEPAPSTDPLYCLMNGEPVDFSPEHRQYMLNDYFEGEWNPADFR